MNTIFHKKVYNMYTQLTVLTETQTCDLCYVKYSTQRVGDSNRMQVCERKSAFPFYSLTHSRKKLF